MAWLPIYQFGTGTGGSGNGAPGPRGQDANQWLSGQGAPARTLGREQDLYFQSDTGQVWQKKSPFFGFPPAWSVIATLPPAGPRGPAGVPGAAGPAGTPGTIGPRGADGANGTNGTTVTGHPLIVVPPGCNLASTSGAASAQVGYLITTLVPATMLLDKMGFQVTTGNSGTVQWGLFDFTSNPAAATKLAGGSGTLASTGYQTIAAASNPVTIAPGGYAIIVFMPATNFPVVIRSAWQGSNVIPIGKFQTSYVWSDTPDLTSGWTSDAVALNAILHGRLAAGTTW